MIIQRFFNLRILAGVLGLGGVVAIVTGLGVQWQWPWQQTVLISVMGAGIWLLIVINWSGSRRGELGDYKLLASGDDMNEKEVQAEEEDKQPLLKVEDTASAKKQIDPTSELLLVDGKLNEDEKREWLDWLLREQQR